MNKEKEFINIINKILNKDLKKGFVVGIGDDAAILTSNGNNKMAICSDTIVEDIHFKLDYFSFEEGRYSFNEDELKDIVTSSVQNALEKSIASSLVELAVSEIKNNVSGRV